jgi:preprotein translocase subunit SecD
VDFFKPIAQSDDDTGLPRGLRFQIENAPVGLGRTKPVHYGLLIRGEDEDQRAALARFRKWVATLRVPSDREIGFEPYYEFDEDQGEDGAEVLIGWRTFYLFAKPDLDATAVLDAQARPERPEHGTAAWFVSIQFTPEGGRRFEELTASLVKRRFAILVDGVVQSAPVVQSAIGGGWAQITMGQSKDPESQLRDARRLEVVLRSGALPAPIALESAQRIPQSAALYTVGRTLPGVASLACIAFFALLALDRAKRRSARTPSG